MTPPAHPVAHPRCRPAFGLVLTSALMLAFSFSLRAQTPARGAATGTIAGTVANAATNQFLGEAEVRVAGTSLAALTDRDGSYRLTGVPAGAVTLTVSYTGLDPEKRPV